ncbi:hypothetical protein V498_10672 [Pseudogymnoascus sp. VKM F-4517 (FW-2822)]|nr:hypothetical protein V498_10672 [Pseudogymnoascus sp. VKM F-4517 (FW-2822)]
MRVSTILTLAASIFAAGTTAITGDEGVAEFQKLATATTEYNNQLSMINDETGFSEGYRASIGLIHLKYAFEASVAKFKEGIDPDPSKIPPEVSAGDADRILAKAKTVVKPQPPVLRLVPNISVQFLDLLNSSVSELLRIHDITATTPHHYDIQSAFEPILDGNTSLGSVSGNLQIWLPIDKWTPTDNLFNPTIAKIPTVMKAYRTL